MANETQNIKLPDALNVAQQAESCQKSLKLPKSCRATCGQGYFPPSSFIKFSEDHFDKTRTSFSSHSNGLSK